MSNTFTPVHAESSSGPSAPPTEPMSKSQMKKQAKLERQRAMKGEKRIAEKARRKERMARLKVAYEAGTLTVEERTEYDKRRAMRHARKGDKGVSDHDWKGGVIVDLGFDELMHDGEITSMASQLGYVYSANRLASRPFSTVLHTSFGPTASPRLWQTMSKHSWQRWNRSYWWEQGLDKVTDAFSTAQKEVEATEATILAEQSPAVASTTTTAESGKEADPEDLVSFLSGLTLPSGIVPESQELVYLSADSETELETLSEDEVYIIGGIVDRNRHKNKAEELGIRTARLPIGTYLESLPTRKVLTVNQVFEILCQYIALNDWGKAFHAVIPIRKYAGDKEAQKRRKLEQGSSVGRDGLTGGVAGWGLEVGQEDVEDTIDEEEAMNA